MERFINQFGSQITGVLRGIDRIMIKGYISDFYHNNNFYYFLSKEQVQLKDYKEYVLKITSKIKESIEGIIKETGCHYEYLRSSEMSKEDIARRIIQESNNTSGLVCVLSAVEPCYALSVIYNKQTGKLEKHNEYRKCQHYYFYYNDKELGLIHIRLQTWFPFSIQIYLNGKEYLKRQLENEGIKFTSYDNSVNWVEDIEKAQHIADKFIEKKWYATFDSFAGKINSFLPRIKEIFNGHAYQWFVEQCEYATDVMFKEREQLALQMPKFIEYASLCQMGDDVFTFFGRKVHGLCQGEAVSDRKHFFGQGFRVKFKLDHNSIKLYDKSNVLRVETTINNPGAFKVLAPQNKKQWAPMGKSIANLYRYAEVSRACNDRYLNSLAEVNPTGLLTGKIGEISCPVETKLSTKSQNLRRFSGFNLLSDFNCRVFEAVNNGAFAIRGFTNRIIRGRLLEFGVFKTHTLSDKQLSNKITRLIAKLRAHKLITKMPNTARYRVSHWGAQIISQILLFKKQELIFKIC
jgi:hypothetical protein